MTELQTKVFNAIKSATSDEERTKLAISAMSSWYLERGRFAESYRLDMENFKK
jgi:hypothetical protein